MRPARVLERSAGGARVVQGHPAGREAHRDHPVAVAIVLMESERFGAGRFPDNIVLTHARAGPPREGGADAPDLLGEHDARNDPIGLPAIADLASPVGRIAVLPPVPFVGIEAGLELAAK